jgi:TPR repeat protein
VGSRPTRLIVEAVRLYRLAAEQGYVDGRAALGRMYADGEGVPQDDVLAYMWHNLAAANGYVAGPFSASAQVRAEQRMTREQIAEGQRMSTEWIEAHPGGN